MVVSEIGSFLAFLVTQITEFVSEIGYPGIFILMVMESAALPVPSEIVMPFAGYLASQLRFNIWAITLVGSLANLVGSLIIYFIGMSLGRKFIINYGKYILLKKKVLVMSEVWFKKYGERAVFFARMLPVIRTFISLPAGIGKMNLPKFLIYTFIGSLPWNFALTYLGFWLGKNWDIILRYSHWMNIGVIAIVIILIIWYILRKR